MGKVLLHFFHYVFNYILMLINLDNKVICLKDVSDKNFHLRDVRDDDDVIDNKED